MTQRIPIIRGIVGVMLFSALLANNAVSPSASFSKASSQSVQVVSATLTVSPEVYDGQCPITFKFSGNISVKGKGSVSYTFVRSDGATGPIYTLDFNGDDTKPVDTTWSLSLPAFSEWIAIKILSPNQLQSNQAWFKGTCIKAATSSDDQIKQAPIKEAPKTEKEMPPDQPAPEVDQIKPMPKSEKELPRVDRPSPGDEIKQLPKGVEEAPQGQLEYHSAGRNWDFEEGLAGWTSTGDAFRNQPTLGDNVIAARVRIDMTLENGGIGGDYWKRVPYPIRHHLNAWIGTYENHPDAAAPLGAETGDRGTGTLSSGDFPLDEDHRFIAFAVGGGSNVATERVELQVRGENAADAAEVERLVGANRGGLAALAGLFGGSGRSTTPLRDGNYVIALTASGQNSEVMRQIVFEVPSSFRGRSARIRIVDNSDAAWGHINVDDFQFASARPAERPARVWGFADTHSHPMNDLSFGGNVVQGSLYARDGSPYASESFRKTALPPMFENINWSQLSVAASLLSAFASGATAVTHGGATASGRPSLPGIPALGPVGAVIAGESARELTRPMRSGYPELQGYPGLNQMTGQQMYGEWIRRAYDGGLRLMSTLAVNNWLASSHPVKRAVLGTSAPEDDKGSANAQVEDIKAWAARPENRSWVEVARTPADARRIIAANKLAIVIGLELDVLGNFVLDNPEHRFREPGVVVMPSDDHPAEQRALIAAEVRRLYLQGVRQIGPFHYVSGVWGGTAMFQRLFNEVSRKVTGDNVVVASGDALGIRYRLDMDSWGLDGIATRTLVSGEGPARQSDPSWEATHMGHINSMGLSQAGEILFDELARRGMIIDLDHASQRSTDRMLELATERDYPVMSSHTDYLETGFTGPGEFTHSLTADNDEENLRLFDTSTLSPLRNEGMASRHKIETIARLGGTTGVILWLPRRKTWGHAVLNDCDGSSKTWAQNYQYAIDVTGGRGVALSTDRITLGPRFGPNAAYLLGAEHDTMYRRDERRFAQVDAQRNGVRYDVPIREWHAFRFAGSAGSAWDKTPYLLNWEQRPREHEDAWKAIAAWSAGRNPRSLPYHANIELSGDLGHPQRVVNYAWGLWASNEAELESDCGLGCDPGTLNERYAAYCIKNHISPYALEHWRGAPGIVEQARWFSTVWEEWQHMNGSNDPLRRHIFGNRDFDVNIDGTAHYGMLPDFLQDVANSHPRPAEVGAYLDPLFRSAESYIEMWEKARRVAGLSDRDP